MKPPKCIVRKKLAAKSSDTENSPKRILIVDDDADFGETISELLQNRGFECRLAISFSEARETIPEFQPDVALLDVRLENADGIELIRLVERGQADAVSVMVTGNADVDSAIRSLKEGAYDYLRKPVEIDYLLHTIDRCFERINLARERASALEQLRQSENDLNRTQRLARLGSWLWEIESDEVWWSNTLYSLLGKDEETRPTMGTFEETVAPRYLGLFREAHDHNRTNIDYWENDLEIIRGDGETRWVHMIREFRRNPAGEITHVAGVFQDMTEKHQLELEKHEQVKLLMQANKMIALGELATGLAHQLSNPNHVIKINVTLFGQIWRDIRPILDAYYEEHADHLVSGINYDEIRSRIPLLLTGITDSADRVNMLIARMREFAYEKSDEVIQDIAINEVVNASVSLTTGLINQSTKEFDLSLEEDLPCVRGNFKNFQQAFVNVIQNACDALESRNDKIFISTGYAGETKEVQIVIRDEGRGIAAEDLPKIIEPFFTTRRTERAMGLGLFSTHALISEHGGTLRFKSGEDRGTCVTISLPANIEAPTTLVNPS
jgi:signal transduction histidine kinase/DNA-binding response OmpR family regulator